MTAPLVSIALCTYNGEKFVAQLLDTLESQTYPNIEIIAVDDCSTDNTFAILSGYASRNARITLHQNKKNLGFTANFENALTYCKGELIAFCDQDDLWHPEKIALQVNALGNNLLIYHDSEFINEQNESLEKKMSDVLNFYRGDDPKAFLFFNCVSGHAMLIKRELLNDARPFKQGHYHDWWLAYVATNTGCIDYLPQCLVRYRQHDDNDTDLLKRKDAARDRHRDLSMRQTYHLRIKWLEQCAGYAKNKDPDFAKTLYYLYNNRVNDYLSMRLAILMESNVDILYFIQKKSRRKKKLEVIKLAWGYKTKNFWYKYIRRDPGKIVS